LPSPACLAGTRTSAECASRLLAGWRERQVQGSIYDEVGGDHYISQANDCVGERVSREERRVRPTIRCLEEDLALTLPNEDVDLGEIEHDLLSEARRIAPTSPKGQKRIQAIADPLVFRIRQSVWRGATWVDEGASIMWLLAAATREEGSQDDAYEYFEALHRQGRLLPTDDDRRRDRVEAGARLLSRIQEEAPAYLAEARDRPGQDATFVLAGILEIRLHVIRTPQLEEIWLAVSTRLVNGDGASLPLRDLVFVTFEQAAGQAEWELRADWPSGELRWFERARLGLRES